MLNTILDINNYVSRLCQQYVADFLLLFVRYYVAIVFLKSGWLKLNSWSSTLYLFEMEYQVPLLNFKFAAILGTGFELLVPLLLVFGLFTQLSALGLFIFNVIAVISYPSLWDGGFYDHKLWGLLMLITLFYGAGKVSIDQLLYKSR